MKKFRTHIGLVLIPAIAIGALFYIPGPNSEPLMNMAKLRRSLDWDWSLLQKAKQTGHKAKEKAKAVAEKAIHHLKSNKTEDFDASCEAPDETLFKWRDNEGNLHFSNQIPPDSVEFEIVDN